MTKNEELAIEIIEVFEDLLEEKGITIPCDDSLEENERWCDGNSARIYGMEYWRLEEKIAELLGEK